MGFELAPGTLLNNRYQIKKVVAFSDDGGVYVARDLKVTDKNWIVKEIIPSERLDEQALAERKQYFLGAIESAMQFDHPGLARILDHFTESRREYVIMEQADGVTLRSLCEMTVNPLPEKQVLGWGLQICDALGYCHNRPKPFIFSAISPNHVILTSDEKIKLINYGLDRFFSPDTPVSSLADSSADVPREFQRFGETLAFLLTKEKPAGMTLAAGANVSHRLAQVANRCMQSDSEKPYPGFDEVKRELELVLNPPATPTLTEPRPRKQASVSGPPLAERVLDVLAIILSQRRAFLYAEAVLLVAVILGLWFWRYPVYNYTRSGPTGYIATANNGFASIQMDTGKTVDQRTLEGPVGDLLVDPAGRVLMVSLLNGNKLLRLDVKTNLPLAKGATVSVDLNPSRMVTDPFGKMLYVLHETRNNVSRVNLTSEPPQTEGVIAVGRGPRDLAVSRDGKQLFVANGQDQTVSVIEAGTGRIVTTITVPGVPTALAPSADNTTLWVACQSPDSICALDLANQAVSQTLTEIGGKKPSSILLSANGSRLYVANNGSNSVSVFDTTEPKLLKTVAMVDHPQRILSIPGDRMWVVCSGGVVILDPIRDAAEDRIKPPGQPTGPAAISR